MPETVREPAREQGGKLFALLVGKTRVHVVGGGVFEVDFPVRHIEIAAEHGGLLRVQPGQIVLEIVFPAHAVVQPLEFPLGIGRVAIHQIKIREFQGDHAALVVVLLDANAHGYRKRLCTREHRRAGIALFLRAVEDHFIAFQRNVRLMRLHLGFLQADHIRVQRAHGIGKPLLQAGSQAVHVPGYQLHFASSSFRSLARWILPETVLGNSSTNSRMRGYLYGAVTRFTCRCNSLRSSSEGS